MDAVHRNRWLPLLVLAIVAGTMVVNVVTTGSLGVFDVVFGLVLGAFVWWSWPGRSGTHVDHRQAQQAAADGDVVVYWRPG